MTLNDLGMKYGTDKATYHNFCDYYDTNLSHLRKNDIRFLEIGILNGASLRMWHDYFTNAEIIGADLLNCKFLENERIKTYIVNQEIKQDLLSIPGDFDIIVDDGGHTMFQQQLTLSVMFKKLKSQGVYILEDLHTSQLQFQPHGYGCTEINNTHKLLEDIMNGKITGEYYLNSSDFEDLVNSIESIEIHVTNSNSVTSIIKKKKSF